MICLKLKEDIINELKSEIHLSNENVKRIIEFFSRSEYLNFNDEENSIKSLIEQYRAEYWSILKSKLNINICCRRCYDSYSYRCLDEKCYMCHNIIGFLRRLFTILKNNKRYYHHSKT